MAQPLQRPATFEFDLPDEAATASLARSLAAHCRLGDVIGLKGELGVGKTSFARAFINALPRPDGPGPAEEVPSPTFTLVQIYDRLPAPIWHFDLYRIEQCEEVRELGLEEALTSAITLIEWPERLGPAFPVPHLEVALSYQPRGGRHASLCGAGDWPRRLLDFRPT
jgi:tRNA threonylcarbamoyladenosine biosynthesis protein TsaE